MKKMICVFVFLLFGGVIFAQIELFGENERGFNFNCQRVPFLVDYGRSSVDVGYTGKGKYHIGFALKSYSDFANSWIGFAVSYSRLLLEQNETIPLNVIIEESFEYGIMPISDFYSIYQTVELSGAVSHSFDLNKFKIVPIGGFAWSYTLGNEYLRSANHLNASIKCLLSFKRFFVFPELILYDSYYDFYLGFGFVLPTHSRITQDKS